VCRPSCVGNRQGGQVAPSAPVQGSGIKTGGARLPCLGSSDPSPPPDRSTLSLEHVAPSRTDPSCERPLLSAPMSILGRRSGNRPVRASRSVGRSSTPPSRVRTSKSVARSLGDLLILLDRPDYRLAFPDPPPRSNRSARSPRPKIDSLPQLSGISAGPLSDPRGWALPSTPRSCATPTPRPLPRWPAQRCTQPLDDRTASQETAELLCARPVLENVLGSGS
jgi:hypothetical protein